VAKNENNAHMGVIGFYETEQQFTLKCNEEKRSEKSTKLLRPLALSLTRSGENFTAGSRKTELFNFFSEVFKPQLDRMTTITLFTQHSM
jgi:hypothetical protein